MAFNPMSAEARFWPKVDQNGPVPAHRPELGPCWLWTACKIRNGYGQLWAEGGAVYAHRFSYELFVGSIPEGLTLDHLCRVRHCVNPDHLEPVTNQENIARGDTYSSGWNREKTHCPAGHPYDEANTYRWRHWRRCRICQMASNRRCRDRRRAKGRSKLGL